MGQCCFAKNLWKNIIYLIKITSKTWKIQLNWRTYLKFIIQTFPKRFAFHRRHFPRGSSQYRVDQNMCRAPKSHPEKWWVGGGHQYIAVKLLWDLPKPLSAAVHPQMTNKDRPNNFLQYWSTANIMDIIWEEN